MIILILLTKVFIRTIWKITRIVLGFDMEKNLFSNLVKYKPTLYQTPLENFTTQILAYLLKENLDFREKFLTNNWL